ncbi:phytoene/squalene synthase family protein [methane-oxidizing endosymbiont of Gigantopelta aegis]|uniref:phytoene/squalene synthase family protein n=1 Tax=methane-oxidizing endosymbiont of Gigantopelta aegis TaxID=2794938 RepID=UPI0018DB9E9A|nr:phytoene/squalene synthase family protein [methane-oxidizing endosymbiont of Gigantopelta aegis]
MTEANVSINDQKNLLSLPEQDFQSILLEGVSRTFALTIPQLPEGLYSPVANAYLLCRIVDTIEDEVSLSVNQKKYFCDLFIDVTRTGQHAEKFSQELAPLLSNQTLPAEHSLIAVTPRVIEITHSFDREQIDALADCVTTMAQGMPKFQALDLHAGLKTLADLDDYCYYVAGCVGEMLARLFCHYSPEINQHREQLLELSVSFGQGLQMTNILKDIWDDAKRGVCWLPQDIFTETGFDLATLTPETDDKNFRKGLEHLISIAQQHLDNALTYTKLIPSHETGIRNFCLWALGMAVLTLRKIHENLDFNDSSQVKITRKSVKATIFATNLTVRSNLMLTLLFNFFSRPLKTPDWHYQPASQAKQ